MFLSKKRKKKKKGNVVPNNYTSSFLESITWTKETLYIVERLVSHDVLFLPLFE